MVVLITGASGGLGTAVVKAFLQNDAASVIGAALRWDSHPTEDGRFRAIEADLTSPSECARIVEQAGPVDALVHLVGGFSGGKPVAGTSDADWNLMLNLNLTS